VKRWVDGEIKTKKWTKRENEVKQRRRDGGRGERGETMEKTEGEKETITEREKERETERERLR